MSKTIFDYDSSDDEYNTNKQSHRSGEIALSLYRVGNSILNCAYNEYKKKINDIIKKEINVNSYVVNNYLNHHLYKSKDLTKIKFNGVENNDQKEIIQAVTSLKDIYQQVRNILNELENNVPKYNANAKYSKIKMKNLDHFKLLSELINKDNLEKQDKKKLKTTFALNPKKSQEFLNQIKAIPNLHQIEYHINQLGSFDIDLASTLTTLVSLDKELLVGIVNYYKTKVGDTRKAYEIHQQVKGIYDELENDVPKYKADVKHPKINTKNLGHFKLISELINKDNFEEQDKTKLETIFNLNPKKSQEFFNQIKNIRDISNTLYTILEIYKNATPIMQSSIFDIITGKASNGFSLIIQCINWHAETELKFFANKVSNAVPLVIHYIKNLDYFEPLQNSNNEDALNFLSSSLAYQKILRIYSKFAPLGFNISAISTPILFKTSSGDKTIDITQELLFSTKRTEKVINFSTYTSIQKALEKTELGAAEIVSKLQNIIKGKLNNEDIDSDRLKTLLEISYLLFSCESNRNPSALISNAMFLELVKEGKYKISDMATKLPMAIQGAIDVGRYYHEQYERSYGKARRNDYGISQANAETINAFQELEYNLLCDYLGISINKSVYNPKEALEKLLVQGVNKNKHPEYKENKVKETLKSINFSDTNCLDIFKKLSYKQNYSFKDIKKAFKKAQKNYKNSIPDEISKILGKLSNKAKIEKLIQDWYLPKFTMEANSEQ
ncbi:uncharacterized protein LOC136076794 [Hydra vulgaris]|uniref:Uncharacterized protein LOC136076794 n=1 Tax=Hydra vulgaris TaxID=6087 RepID=A0ABM4BBL1_HYDVU